MRPRTLQAVWIRPVYPTGWRTFARVGLVCLLALAGSSATALEVCNDNGGGGWFMPATGNPGAGAPGVFQNVAITFSQGANAIVLDANARVDITYPWVGDIRANLISPAGTNVSLWDRPGTTSVNHRPPWGCSRDNYDNVVIDDESPNGNIESAPCFGFPVYSGSYRPHVANTLANFDQETLDGTWTILVEDAVFYDRGRLHEGCIDVVYANVRFDKWVSTDPTCTDQLDTLTVNSGTDVYYCYEVENTGERQFVIPAGGTTDDQGHDISALEVTYAPGAVETVIVGPFEAGVDLPVGITTNTATITAEGDDTEFPSTITMNDSQTADLTVIGVPDTSIVMQVTVIWDPINLGVNPQPMPGGDPALHDAGGEQRPRRHQRRFGDRP